MPVCPQAPPHPQRLTHALRVGASSGAREDGLLPPLTTQLQPMSSAHPGLRGRGVLPAFPTGDPRNSGATPPSGLLPFKGSKSGWRARPGRGVRRVPPRACPSAGAARDAARRESAPDGQVGPRRAKAGGGTSSLRMTVSSDGPKVGAEELDLSEGARKGASWIRIKSMFNIRGQIAQASLQRLDPILHPVFH